MWSRLFKRAPQPPTCFSTAATPHQDFVICDFITVRQALKNRQTGFLSVNRQCLTNPKNDMTFQVGPNTPFHVSITIYKDDGDKFDYHTCIISAPDSLREVFNLCKERLHARQYAVGTSVSTTSNTGEARGTWLKIKPGMLDTLYNFDRDVLPLCQPSKFKPVLSGNRTQLYGLMDGHFEVTTLVNPYDPTFPHALGALRQAAQVLINHISTFDNAVNARAPSREGTRAVSRTGTRAASRTGTRPASRAGGSRAASRTGGSRTATRAPTKRTR
jgi:hypothetical protein